MDVACKHHSVNRVLGVLRDGGIPMDDAGGGGSGGGKWVDFARDLCRRCSPQSANNANDGTSPSAIAYGGTASGEGQATTIARKPTNAEMLRKATDYSLLEMEEVPPLTLPKKTKSDAKSGGEVRSVAQITVGSKSTAKSHGDKSRKKERSKNLSVKHEDETSGKKYEDEEEERLEKAQGDSSKGKQRKRRRRHSFSSSEDEGVDAAAAEERRWEMRERRREEQMRRKKRQQGSDDDDGDIGRKHRDVSKLTEEERAEIERERDIRERDEFAKRLLEKDKKKQRSRHDEDERSRGSRSSDGSSVDSEEEREREAQKRMRKMKRREERDRRLARGEAVTLDSDSDENDPDKHNNDKDKKSDNKEKKTISIHDMRMESRRAYLQKRTKRELELLSRELQDEEELIAQLGGISQMTEEEKRELELKREILRMAKEHGHVDDENDESGKKPDGFYRLPEEYDEDNRKGKTRSQRGEELLTSRYVEPQQEKSEQELWEEGQTQMAAGLSRHKKKGAAVEQEEEKYDFVFEDQQIDFVMMDTKKGYDNRKVKRNRELDELEEEKVDEDEAALEMRPVTKHEKILEGRKKLPVYPYREDFLMALKDHQILVLVGETGSGKSISHPKRCESVFHH